MFCTPKSSIIIFTTSLLILFITASGCTKKDATTVVAATESTSTLTDTSASFPIDFALASPTASSELVALRAKEKADHKALGKPKEAPSAEETAVMSYDEKVEVMQELINGETVEDCDFTFALNLSNDDATCYGPEVNYMSHPDYDPQNQASQADGMLPIGDLGIWTPTDGLNNEACAAAQLNTRVANIAGQIDSIMLTSAAINCIARVNELELPEAGEDLDLTTEVSEAFTTNEIGFTVSSAHITRDTDTAEGYPVYVTTLDATTVDADSENTRTLSLRLKHIPTADDNSTYKGKLSYTLSDEGGASTLMWCSNDILGATGATSIAYEKVSSTDMRYLLNTAQYCGFGADTDPYVSATNYTVDATKKSIQGDDGDPHGWASDYYFGNFNMNLINQTGNFQFGWQAGSPDSATRVLNASLVIDADTGTTSGCSYFGYGPDATTTIDNGLGTITTMYCNWAGPEGAAFTQDKASKGVTKAQQQCISKATDATLFSSDSAHISYAPTLNCNHSGAPFIYQISDESSDPLETAFTNDLVDLSSIDDLTAPTEAVDVDAE